MKKVFLLLSIAAVLFISACGGGGGGSSAPATTAPSAPTGVTIAAGDAQASLSWTAAAGATSYNVYYGMTTGVTSSTGTKVTGATSGGAITGLAIGTTYYFVATSENTAGESAISAEVSALPVAAPSAPAGVVLASGNAQVTLTWPAVSGATSYNVYYRTTAGVTTTNGTKIANTTSGTAITGLVNGTSYYFVVTAVKSTSESATSSEAGAVPQATLTGTPTGLSASTGENGQVRLSWTTVTGATSYNVYYGTTSGVTPANGTKVTGATSGNAITDLTNGTLYYFIVTAMNNATENPASPWISATPKAIPNLLGGAIQKPLTLTGAVTTVNTVDSAGVAQPINVFNNFGITTDGTYLYVSGWFKYYKILIATGEIVASADGSNGNGLTTDGNNLYLGGYYGVSKYVFANATATVFAGYPYSGGSGSIDGVGTAARFGELNGITMDETNLYVADSANHTIRKIVIATKAVTTLAGTSGLNGTADATGAAARFNTPKGITTDGTYLYVSDTGNNLIRKIVISTGEVTTLAGGYTGLSFDGTGAGAQFKAPWGITTDGSNLYVVDSGAHIVRKIVTATGVVTTIAGTANSAGNTNGTGSAALFSSPRTITTDGVRLYVGDYTNSVIRRIQ